LFLFKDEIVIYLDQEDKDIKNDYPVRNLHLHLKSEENKIQQQEEQVHENGDVSQYHKTSLEPGQPQNQVCISRSLSPDLDVPQ
jgi:hypothetical protein